MENYTKEEVSKHTTKSDLWVSVDGKVYDVTDFCGRHPGGENILMEHGGEDVTEFMDQLQPHKHSKSAYLILKKYYIGQLNDTPTEVRRRKNGKIRANGVTNNHITTAAAADTHEETIIKNGAPVILKDSKTAGERNLKLMNGWREGELVDWNKPILHQVGFLGDDYFEWVHSPVDKHVRLFASDFLEFFGDTPWWLVPLVWLPVTSWFLYLSYGFFLSQPNIWCNLELKWHHTPILVMCGVVLWTFLEYVMHRWCFHLKPPPSSPFFIRAHFLLHGQHHKAPFCRTRLVFPPMLALPFALLFLTVYVLLFPKGMAFALLAGTTIGYVVYDLTHYYLHHGWEPWIPYFKRLRRYHVKHHFVNQQKGFGISSNFWDYPFQTVLPED